MKIFNLRNTLLIALSIIFLCFLQCNEKIEYLPGDFNTEKVNVSVT